MKNNIEINGLIDEYPKIEYKIRVVSMFPNKNHIPGFDLHVTKTIIEFLEKIIPGDELLFEYPVWYDGKYGSGMYVFSIPVTNLRTGKTILVRSPKLQYIYRSIEEYEVL